MIGDTGGPAGMMMALRSIPIYLNICHEMEKRCPRAILFNHSNPLAVLVRAMIKYTSINVVGICHGVREAIVHVSRVMDIPPHELDGVTDRLGVRGVCVGEAPLTLEDILHRRIIWQELVADAGAKGDRNLALHALLLDEMAIQPEKAECMLDELLAASKPMLPQFRD